MFFLKKLLYYFNLFTTIESEVFCQIVMHDIACYTIRIATKNETKHMAVVKVKFLPRRIC